MTTIERLGSSGRPLGVLVLLSATLAGGGCRPVSDGNAPRGVDGTPQAPGATAARGGTDHVDAAKSFIDTAASGGRAEVELAGLALDKGTSEPVKELARMIQQDHTQANAELIKVSRDIGATPDDTLKPDQQALVQRLAALTGVQFDAAYAEAMVDEHRKSVQAFSEGARLQEDAVRDFAERTLPTLRTHLEHAERVHGGGRPPGPSATR